MKTREVPDMPTPPNLKAYEEKFGHRQSPEASRAHPRAVLDQMAKEALEKGEPIPQWRDRHKTRLGNVNDQRYKNLKWESEYEELAWHKSMSETLKTYLHLFGHAPDNESYQKLTIKQINRLAKNSLKTGFPVKRWKESSPYELSIVGSKYFGLTKDQYSEMPWYRKIQNLLTEFLPYRRHYVPIHVLLDNTYSSVLINLMLFYESKQAKKDSNPYRANYFVRGFKSSKYEYYSVSDYHPFFSCADRYLIETDSFHPYKVQRHIMKNVSKTKQRFPSLNFNQQTHHFIDGEEHCSSWIQFFRLNFMNWEEYDPNESI